MSFSNFNTHSTSQFFNKGGMKMMTQNNVEETIKAGRWPSVEECWSYLWVMAGAGLRAVGGVYFALSLLKYAQEEYPNQKSTMNDDAKAYASQAGMCAAVGGFAGKLIAKKSWQFFKWIGNRLSSPPEYQQMVSADNVDSQVNNDIKSSINVNIRS
jgi:hypothetical protein